jgi:hypothetical protein
MGEFLSGGDFRSFMACSMSSSVAFPAGDRVVTDLHQVSSCITES